MEKSWKRFSVLQKTLEGRCGVILHGGGVFIGGALATWPPREFSKAHCHVHSLVLSQPLGSLSSTVSLPHPVLSPFLLGLFCFTDVHGSPVLSRETFSYVIHCVVQHFIGGRRAWWSLEFTFGPRAIELILKRSQQLTGFVPGKDPKKEGRTFYFQEQRTTFQLSACLAL